MAPKRARHAAMVLLTSASLRNGLSSTGPRCSRCFASATTRSLRAPRQAGFPGRGTPPCLRSTSTAAARPTHRRSFASSPESNRSVDPNSVDLSKFVDASEPVELDPSKPLPADGKHVAIVGGGLTGLTAAYYMASSVGPSTRITLYEANSRLGGWIRTDKVTVDVGGKKGVVNFERGPRSLSSLTTNTSRFDDLVFYDLCIRLGLKPHVAPNLPRYLFYPDHLVPVPTSMAGFISDFMKEELWWKTIPSAAFGYLRHTLSGRPAPPKEPSITEFIEHVFGSSTLADNMVSGMIHGIYGGDIDRLSAPAALYPMYQRFWKRDQMGADLVTTNLDMRTLACFVGDAAVRKMAKDIADRKGALLHFGSQGLQALPDALEEVLRSQPNIEIKTSTPLREIDYSTTSKKITVTEENGATQQFDKVYTTIGAHDLRKLVPGKLSALDEFEAVSIMAVNLWFPEPNLKPPGFGYLIPRAVSQELNPDHALGVFFDSDIGNNHPDEPQGTKLFVLMGGHHYEKPGVRIPTPDEAVQQARNLLERHLGIPTSMPCHAEAKLSRNCIPQHNVGHAQLTDKLGDQLQDQFEGRLFPTGGSFTRIGGMAAIRDGWLAGTLGLDQSKPVYQDYLRNGWEGMLGPMWFEMNMHAPMYHELVSSVRTARYPPEKQHVLRALMSPESRHTIFKSPSPGKQ